MSFEDLFLGHWVSPIKIQKIEIMNASPWKICCDCASFESISYVKLKVLWSYKRTCPSSMNWDHCTVHSRHDLTPCGKIVIPHVVVDILPFYIAKTLSKWLCKYVLYFWGKQHRLFIGEYETGHVAICVMICGLLWTSVTLGGMVYDFLWTCLGICGPLWLGINILCSWAVLSGLVRGLVVDLWSSYFQVCLIIL